MFTASSYTYLPMYVKNINSSVHQTDKLECFIARFEDKQYLYTSINHKFSDLSISPAKRILKFFLQIWIYFMYYVSILDSTVD